MEAKTLAFNAKAFGKASGSLTNDDDPDSSSSSSSSSAVGAAAWGGASSGVKEPRWDDDDAADEKQSPGGLLAKRKKRVKQAKAAMKTKKALAASFDSMGAEPAYAGNLRPSSSLLVNGSPAKEPSSSPRPPWHENHAEHFHLEATTSSTSTGLLGPSIATGAATDTATAASASYEHQRGGLGLLRAAHPRRKARKDHPLSDIYV
jgi:hypothetical protein